MKVLHVLSYFPPDRIGGVGEVVRYLHQGLIRRGHESVVLTSGCTLSDPTVKRIAPSIPKYLLRVWRYAGMARDFDIVHFNHGEAGLLLLAIKLRRIRTPVLVSFHCHYTGMARASSPYKFGDQWFARGIRDWIYRNLNAPVHLALDWLAIKLADGFTCVSRAIGREFFSNPLPAGVRVIYNAVPAAASAEVATAEPVELLYVGVNNHRKRVNILPFVLKKVRESVPAARLRLVGVGLESRPDQRKLFEALGVLDAVVDEGKIPSEQIHRFYAAAQVLITPSAYEPFGMVIIEAFRAGLPCVSTRSGGPEEIIQDGENGFLVGVDDIDAMADRCVRLLQDASLRKRMSQSARTAVRECFDVERQVDEFVEVYQQMTAKLGGS